MDKSGIHRSQHINVKQLADNPSGQQNYMPQLDALRFFAVLGVLVSHFWIPKGLVWFFADMDWGWIGVRLFFVLSGFLITGILLDARKIAETTTLTPLYLIRQFYIRRFLRIFPVYYLVVGIALVLNIVPGREIWGWLVSYTTNIYITVFNTWIGDFSHFWSLAVEEQFYLFWPCLILFLPKKWLAPLITLAILVAPVYRFWVYQVYRYDISPFDFKAATFTLASLDSLGMGALLALQWRGNAGREMVQRYTSRVILPIGLVLYFGTLALFHYRIRPSVFFTLNDFALSLIFSWLVAAAAIGFRNSTGKILSFPVFVYLGKISYGIYIYHYFMPWILVPIFDGLGFELQVPGLLNFVLAGALSIAVASISWHWFEYPINNLKRYFQYVPPSNH